MFRGDIFQKEILDSIASFYAKKLVYFVDWCPTRIKITMSSSPPKTLPMSQMASTQKSCFMFSNSMAIAEVFSSLDHKFDLLYAKRGFVHWYIG